MSFLEELENNTTIENTKGGKYYQTTYDANLDLFVGVSRFNDTDEIIQKFKKALCENEDLALANLLYILDIREGKGERLLFKTMFEYLCKNKKELALKVLYKIPEYGRWDYILVGLDTLIDTEVVNLIKKQLEEDKANKTPSLLAKWLPSHKAHGVKNETAQKIKHKLDMTEEEYRKTLTGLRKKINLIESKLSSKQYENIDFEAVPTKALLKYRKSFLNHCFDEFEEYLDEVRAGKKKINTTGLYCYEIIKPILLNNMCSIRKRKHLDIPLLDEMWRNQKDFLKGYNKNILVIADTSGSMQYYGCLPLANSIGLATYIAERNTGAFKDCFITFSCFPTIQKVVGENIRDKVDNYEVFIENTDIDAVFELLLNTAEEKKIPQEEMPEMLIIISDMEFDEGVFSEEGTNFKGWRKAFEEKGYKLPKIIFWNVAGNTMGVPVTKFENDVAMVSGFSTAILDNILTLENYTPTELMLQTIEKYVKVLQEV